MDEESRMISLDKSKKRVKEEIKKRNISLGIMPKSENGGLLALIYKGNAE